jgi:hypothetical protein
VTLDHVGVVVQTEDKKIVVLEALGKVGVEINEWDKFISREWYKLYERCAMLIQDGLPQTDLQKR